MPEEFVRLLDKALDQAYEKTIADAIKKMKELIAEHEEKCHPEERDGCDHEQ